MRSLSVLVLPWVFVACAAGPARAQFEVSSGAGPAAVRVVSLPARGDSQPRHVVTKEQLDNLGMEGVGIACHVALRAMGPDGAAADKVATAAEKITGKTFDVAIKVVEHHDEEIQSNLWVIQRDGRDLQALHEHGKNLTGPFAIELLSELSKLRGQGLQQEQTAWSFLRQSAGSPDAGYVVVREVALESVLAVISSKMEHIADRLGVGDKIREVLGEGVARGLTMTGWKGLKDRADIAADAIEEILKAAGDQLLDELVRDRVKEAIRENLDEAYDRIKKDHRPRRIIRLTPGVIRIWMTTNPAMLLSAAPWRLQQPHLITAAQLESHPVFHAEVMRAARILRLPELRALPLVIHADPVVNTIQTENQVTRIYSTDTDSGSNYDHDSSSSGSSESVEPTPTPTTDSSTPTPPSSQETPSQQPAQPQPPPERHPSLNLGIFRSTWTGNPSDRVQPTP